MRNVLELLHSKKISKKERKKSQIFFNVGITEDSEL